MTGRSVPPRVAPKRRVPRWGEFAKLVKLRSEGATATERKLSRLHTIEDLRVEARKSVPRSVFEFVDGGAEEELTIDRTHAAFRRVEFKPRGLAGVGAVDTSTTLFGQPVDLPV